MWLKYPVLFLAFFIMAVIQNNFLPYFAIMGAIPNLIFILFFTVIFFQNNDKIYSWQNIFSFENIFIIAAAEFFLDVFSNHYFGFYAISLIVVYIFINFSNHFFRDQENKNLFIYFICLFLAAFIIFKSLVSVLQYHFILYLNLSILADLAYNLIFAFAVFYGYNLFRKKFSYEKQLKLF